MVKIEIWKQPHPPQLRYSPKSFVMAMIVSRNLFCIGSLSFTVSAILSITRVVWVYTSFNNAMLISCFFLSGSRLHVVYRGANNLKKNLCHIFQVDLKNQRKNLKNLKINPKNPKNLKKILKKIPKNLKNLEKISKITNIFRKISLDLNLFRIELFALVVYFRVQNRRGKGSK